MDICKHVRHNDLYVSVVFTDLLQVNAQCVISAALKLSIHGSLIHITFSLVHRLPSRDRPIWIF